jgi:hypothetical protein
MLIEILPRDTTVKAARVQFDIFRNMQPQQRLELALKMSTSLRNVALAGVRNRHPEYTDPQVKLAYARLTLGEKLFRDVYPGLDIQV